MSLIRFLVHSAGIWWILLGVPALGWISTTLPAMHPAVFAAAAVWVAGVVPACVLSGTSSRNLPADFRAAWRAFRTWFLVVGTIAAAGIGLSLIIR
ncbi:hypothetical protein [Cupriavidus campinensis]|uniref:hypothetical protein n=1 Tax=Cupriavidus campinensis TaxID=151783 RepID=UPI0024E27026|nr:hypothetical protein [Cupriavidus campinensis]